MNSQDDAAESVVFFNSKCTSKSKIEFVPVILISGAG